MENIEIETGMVPRYKNGKIAIKLPILPIVLPIPFTGKIAPKPINVETAGLAEMTANQQAYNTDGKDGKFFGGAEAVEIDKQHITPRNKVNEINGKGQTETMVRTDVDTTDAFHDVRLQQQVQGSNDFWTNESSLNVTSYNVYKGSHGTKPEKLVVGVAGSSGGSDWWYNIVHFSGKSITEMERIASGFNKYKDAHIPIVLVGDSKGGEDAAQLAVVSMKQGIPIDHLFLTNPKGTRINDDGYALLTKLADEGKITKEIVYPEILSTFGLEGGPDIPYSHVMYTVPTKLQDSYLTENHTISNYAEDVYQGFGSRYKFQCNTEPEMLGGFFGIKPFGYRYHVTSVTDNTGKTISVAEYYFEEKRLILQVVKEKLSKEIEEILKLLEENLKAKFISTIDQNKIALEEKHERHIRNALGFSDVLAFKNFKKHQFGASEDISYLEILGKYNKEMQQHVETESPKYRAVILNEISGELDSYQKNLEEQLSLLKQEIVKVESLIDSLIISQARYKESQEEIQLVIDKKVM